MNKKMPKNLSSLRIIIVSSLLLLLSATLTVISIDHMSGASRLKNPGYALLLNSGIVQCEEARINYILWTEDITELPKIEMIISETGLKWEKNVLSNYLGKNAYKYTSTYDIKKENEGQAVEILTSLMHSLDDEKVRVYFEERIDSPLDPAAYFNNNKIELKQKVAEYGLISLSGYSQSLLGDIYSGGEKINVQLVSRSQEGHLQGKSVLAYPVLLEEF